MLSIQGNSETCERRVQATNSLHTRQEQLPFNHAISVGHVHLFE